MPFHNLRLNQHANRISIVIDWMNKCWIRKIDISSWHMKQCLMKNIGEQHGCELNLTGKNRQHDRFVNNYKRKYAEQEFNALKRRCKSQIGQRCTCIVAVRAEDKIIRHTVLNSVVGTLDLIIGHLSSGESFPGGRVNAPDLSNIERSSINRYGYIANLCVLKSSRRKGVARNMLNFAIRLAKEYGAEKVFVHVHTNNGPAQKLYQNVGFQVVEVKNHKLAEEQPHLLFLRA